MEMRKKHQSIRSNNRKYINLHEREIKFLCNQTRFVPGKSIKIKNILPQPKREGGAGFSLPA